MFTLADDKQIGAYLRRAIDKQGYPSVRQFGKACLEEMNLLSNDEELRKMSNRLSQILKGKKGCSWKISRCSRSFWICHARQS